MSTVLNTLFIQTQGSYVHLESDTVRIDVEGEIKTRIPLHHLSGITVFGQVMLSPFLIGRCAQDGRDITWLSRSGRFQGRLHGPVSGNVLLRRAQHQVLNDPQATLEIAKRFVAGKLQNARGTLLRAARESETENDQTALRDAARGHASAITLLRDCSSLDELRGVEGITAKAYFAAFTSLVRTNRDDFTFTERSKRPPRDPINALLSFTYALLTGDCIAALEGVGLDPQVGFLHVLRPGRPALALDLMEEFRSSLADRLALTLINRGQITRTDFDERTGGAWSLNETGRKTVLVAYQKRKQEEITHPTTNKTIPIALVPHVQARLLARHVRGELEHYPPFIPKV
jgi:CRISPR-associated protein Cas1